jgi:hypothetical protein
MKRDAILKKFKKRKLNSHAALEFMSSEEEREMDQCN